MEYPHQKFNKNAAEYIKELWIKRKNPVYRDKLPSYPASLINFVEVDIVGKGKTLFRIRIDDFTKKAKRPTL